MTEELEAALGAPKSARVGGGRQGYRHGTRERTLTTSLGPATFAMPRARIHQADVPTREWQSQTVHRYERRTARVDEVILGVYLAGGNSRRIKGALAPLLRNGPLSKDAVSRLVGRLREDFETWRTRSLADDEIRDVFLDGWYSNVRIGGRRERVPVLVTLGVRANGERVILDLRLVGEESAASWTEVVMSLAARRLARPVLAVIDGNPGLVSALRSHWPGIAIQRCTAHMGGHLQADALGRKRETVMRTMWIGRVLLVGCILAGVSVGSALAQGGHEQRNRDVIDRMRDRELQPERVMDAIKLGPGMVVGEAGASYGYFTLKMSKRVGATGRVYANDIDRAALQILDQKSRAQQIANINTVLGVVDDPLFPRTDLEMIVVFDCLFEFSEPAKWMAKTRRYLKPGGRLVIVDPDPAKLGSSPHFLSRAKIHEFARESGYAVVAVDDSFLKSHMIIALEPKPPRQAR